MDPNSLLSQLRDIHAPPPIDWWPPAIGWWLLLLFILLTLCAVIFFALRYRRKTRWRRQAFRILSGLQNRYLEQPDARHLTEVVMLMKRCAFNTNSDQGDVSSASLETWRQALEQPVGILSESDVQTLYQGHYQVHTPQLDADSFKRIRKWIRSQSQ